MVLRIISISSKDLQMVEIDRIHLVVVGLEGLVDFEVIKFFFNKKVIKIDFYSVYSFINFVNLF